jgi:hypothetical protein
MLQRWWRNVSNHVHYSAASQKTSIISIKDTSIVTTLITLPPAIESICRDQLWLAPS